MREGSGWSCSVLRWCLGAVLPALLFWWLRNLEIKRSFQ